LEGEVPLKKVAFPPAPLNEKMTYQVVSNFCNDTQPELLQEAGCAVCRRLVSIIQMSKLSAVQNLLYILDVKGVTRKEHQKTTDEITEKEGPVLNNHSDRVCDTCRHLLQNNKMPPLALANRLWIGDCPPELSNLTFVEKLLIQRV
jgi:hypothetical protein